MDGRLPRRRLDARALIALAHPLRVRMRDRLRRGGPATATLLARELGESTAATSYHLRMLARHGFVEPDEGRGHGRERWWRATDDVLQMFPSEFVDDEITRDALRVIDGERRRMAEERVGRWLREREAWSETWRDAAENATFAVQLGPAKTRALGDELIAIIDRYLSAEPEPNARPIEIQLDIFPGGQPA